MIEADLQCIKTVRTLTRLQEESTGFETYPKILIPTEELKSTPLEYDTPVKMTVQNPVEGHSNVEIPDPVQEEIFFDEPSERDHVHWCVKLYILIIAFIFFVFLAGRLN